MLRKGKVVTKKHNITSIRRACIAGVFAVLCSLFTVQIVAADNADNNNAIAAAIYQRTGVQVADSDWVKYIKGAFADKSGITDSTSGGAITWAVVPATGVSAPWDGSKLAVTETLPSTHTQGTDELVAETVTDGEGIMTVTYTKYTPSVASGDPDVAVVQLKTVTDTTVSGAKPDYHIYTAEALAYVMQQFATENAGTANPGTAYLERDIDLNGRNHNWFNVRMAQGQDFNGQNHTIYNLCALNNEKDSRSSRSGFICVADSGCEVKNVSFDTAYIVGTHYSGIIGYMNDSGDSNRIENVHVRNITTAISAELNDGQAGAMAGRIEGGSVIKNCSAENCMVFGGNHVGSLTAAVVGKNVSGTIKNAEVANCYSVGCTVYSTGIHSGGLISCGGSINIKDCFTDVELYGSDRTGVFIGVLNGTCNVESCFASGFIEGSNKIGGFLGFVEYIVGGTNVTIKDCYTTALTGLRKGGTQMGGFVGATDDRAVTASSFINCYAAGEVGSVDTDVSPPEGGDYTVDQSQQCGGFIGCQTQNKVAYENCYYDKQTTAMREWAVGHTPQGADRSGIEGVLTTDTDKSGNGLVSSEFSKAKGFNRFTEGGGLSGNWDYDMQEHYPELASFEEATADKWLTEERAALVRAYSLSSTSTMKLETWEKGLDTGTGEMTRDLPETTYCTVRDLTTGLVLTSKNIGIGGKWERIETQDNDGTGEAKTTILREQLDVLSLKNENGVWLCDELVPGIEWLKVTCEDSGKKAIRRVRVIPTVGLEAGRSIVATDKYDHADDVELYYSTAKRMSQDMEDITTGIFPDEKGEANDITARQTALMAGKVMSGDNDKYRDAHVGYMSQGNDNAKDSKLYVYVYPVTEFDPDTNEIKIGTLIDFNENDYADKFNGNTEFEPVDARYLITYMWVMNDGRVIQDAKLLRTPKIPFDVTLDLYRNSITDENLYGNGGYLYVGVDNEVADKPPLTDFRDFDTKGSMEAVASGDADFKEKAQTAWKLTDDTESIKSITVTIGYSDSEEYTATISGSEVVDGNKISIPCIEKRILYKDGAYYTIPETVRRDYTLEYDDAGDVWYLNFDKVNAKESSTEGYDFYLNDVENNIRVDVVVTSLKEGYTITGNKTLTGSKTDFEDNQFTFALKEDSQNDKEGYTGFTGKASLSSNGTITFDTLIFTKPGTYLFTAEETGEPSEGYSYDDASVTITFTVTTKDDGGLLVSPSYEKDGGGDTLSFVNKYMGGDGPDSTDGAEVKTGDDSNMMLYFVIALCAGLALIIVVIIGIRNRGGK